MKRLHVALATFLSVSFASSFAQTLAQTPPTSPPPETLKPPVIVEGEGPKYVAPNTLDRIGRVWAPVMINGKGPFRLVLDTSANSSAIIPSVVEKLGVPLQTGKVALVGVTGKAEVPVVKVDSLDVGEIQFGGGQLPVVPDVFGGAEGVLGPRGFADKRIFIDFRNDAIAISRSTGRAAQPGFTTVDISTDRRQLPIFDIRVGGVKTRAILSTAGERTIGNVALREALLKKAREGKVEEIVGVTLDVAQGQSIAVPPITIGDLSIRNVLITFADTVIFDQWKLANEPAMLVGMDIIGSVDTLIIDYRLQELQIKPRR